MKLTSMENLLQLVGKQLSILRRHKGYTTIKDFAADFNLPAIQYWRIENGKTNPTLESLYKVLRIHKMTVQEFFCEIEAKQKKIRRV